MVIIVCLLNCRVSCLSADALRKRLLPTPVLCHTTVPINHFCPACHAQELDCEYAIQFCDTLSEAHAPVLCHLPSLLVHCPHLLSHLACCPA
jgi:hypothetical protein